MRHIYMRRSTNETKGNFEKRGTPVTSKSYVSQNVSYTKTQHASQRANASAASYRPPSASITPSLLFPSSATIPDALFAFHHLHPFFPNKSISLQSDCSTENFLSQHPLQINPTRIATVFDLCSYIICVFHKSMTSS